MKSFQDAVHAWSRAAALAAVLLGLEGVASAQVVPAGDRGGLTLSAGGMASGYALDYGEQKLLGVSAFVDADTRRQIGVEGEARWLAFRQSNG